MFQRSRATSRWLAVLGGTAVVLLCLSLIRSRPFLGAALTTGVVLAGVLLFAVTTIQGERAVNRRAARAFAEATLPQRASATVEEVSR
jgi:uncharacterized membrane protein YdcZ (DUF606 family)